MNRFTRIWFTIRAKMMGNGKPAIKLYKLKVTVFQIKFFDWNELKNVWKFANPTQGLPSIPCEGEKSLNAICTPYMGK